MKEFFTIFGLLTLVFAVVGVIVTLMILIGNYLEAQYGTVAAVIGAILVVIFIVSIMGAIAIRLNGDEF